MYKLLLSSQITATTCGTKIIKSKTEMIKKIFL